MDSFHLHRVHPAQCERASNLSKAGQQRTELHFHESKPVTSQTLNYAIVAVGIVLTYSFGFWILSARKWFIGPVQQTSGKPTEVAYRSDPS